MGKIIAVHSFRGGTGKSNVTASLAALLAGDGYRVAVIDTDIQSPGVHVLFGISGADVRRSLYDYLLGRCAIGEIAHEVTQNLDGEVKGRVFFVPSSMRVNDIAHVLQSGYDVETLILGVQALVETLDLDVLFIDTHPGLNEATLMLIAAAHALVIVMRPDQQDYEGTAITIDVARELEVSRMMLIVNKVPSVFDFGEVKARVEETYACPVAAVLPHADEMMALASAGVFAMRYPDHPLTAALKRAAAMLVA